MRAIGALRLKDKVLRMAVKLPPEQRRTLKEDLERIEANGMLMMQCKHCEMIVMLVETTSGLTRLYCPHCHQTTLKRWGKVNVAFIPETTT